jgi:hypothetical protein
MLITKSKRPPSVWRAALHYQIYGAHIAGRERSIDARRDDIYEELKNLSRLRAEIHDDPYGLLRSASVEFRPSREVVPTLPVYRISRARCGTIRGACFLDLTWCDGASGVIRSSAHPRIIRIMDDTASVPEAPDFFLHTIDPSGARVIMSYCPRCSGFVAASPSLKIILIAEALHTCPSKAACSPR